MSQFKVMGFTLEVGVCYISQNPLKVFIKLHPNVPLSERVCRCNDSATKTLKGHGHILRSLDIFTLQFSVWLCLKDFFLNHSNALLIELCAEP